MKRSEIIKQIKEAAKGITNSAVEVFTNGANYPKCQLCNIAEYIGDYARPGEALTPYMRPMELLAYVRGMVAGANRTK